MLSRIQPSISAEIHPAVRAPIEAHRITVIALLSTVDDAVSAVREPATCSAHIRQIVTVLRIARPHIRCAHPATRERAIVTLLAGILPAISARRRKIQDAAGTARRIPLALLTIPRLQETISTTGLQGARGGATSVRKRLDTGTGTVSCERNWIGGDTFAITLASPIRISRAGSSMIAFLVRLQDAIAADC
jgi:hypothetical protein